MLENSTILIIDDTDLIRKMMEKMFSKEGYYVLSAADGPTGRQLAIQFQPDLIILDIMMPGEDGFEVIDILKKEPKTSSIPVIFLTAKHDIDSKLRGFESGAVDFIIKPFYAQEVLARVRLHLKLNLATEALIVSQADKLKQIKEAQESMLVSSEDIPDAKFSVYYSSFMEAGGDFYDVLQISEDIYGYFVADVAGHSIKTSYITAAIKALLQQNCQPMYSPEESFQMINQVMTEILPDSVYLTGNYVKLNRKTMNMTIVNAGHPPLLYIPKNGEPKFIKTAGDILGIIKEVHFEQNTIKVNPGDKLFMYTDGLIENFGKKKVWTMGLDDLLESAKKIKDLPMEQFAAELLNLTQKDCKQEDDILALCIEV
ncbi:PP2C family protein-serine/threonine phosphatase [Calditrichota bacterium]